MRPLATPALLLTSLAVAVPAAAAAKAIAVAPAPVFDVGAVAKGEPIRHDFILRNEGDLPLAITEVEASCGCTVAEYDRTIRPRGEGRVRAVIDTAGLRGPVAKALTVHTDDPENPSFDLVIKAIVRSFVEASPGYARFTAVAGEPVAPSVQTLSSPDRPGFAVTEVKSPYPFLKAEVRAASAEERLSGVAGNQWRLTLILAASAPPGPLADYVRVATDHPQQRQLEIPVSGLVRPVVGVIPPLADFGRRELAAPFKASLEVRNYSSRDVAIESVESSLPGIEAKVTPLKAGRHYQLEVTLSPGMPKGEFVGKLTLHTSSRRQPLVEVEVRGTVI